MLHHVEQSLFRLGLSIMLWLLVAWVAISVLSALAPAFWWFLLFGDLGVIAWRIAEAWPQLDRPAHPTPTAPIADAPPQAPPQAPPPPPQAPAQPQKLKLTPIPIFDAPTTAAEADQKSGQAMLDELASMVGLTAVKKEINTLMARVTVEMQKKAQGLKVSPMSLHMVFTGPPGVGKTVVARTLGAVYRDLGVLKRGQVVETARADLVGQYIGQTAPKTMQKIEEAMDGILFIDEAYALAVSDGTGADFGREAIEALLKALEDRRDRFVCIVAGYPAEMQKFLAANSGLASRFTKTIHFETYSAVELVEIFRRMIAKEDLTLGPDFPELELRNWCESRLRDPAFGNARAVRTLVERVRERQAVRLAQEPGDLRLVTAADIQEALL